MKGRAPRKTLIWADKIALCFASLGLLLLAIIWLAGIAIAGEAGAQHLLASIGSRTVDLCGLSTLALWAAMRGIDLLAGGQTYRALKRVVGAISPKPAGETVSAEPTHHLKAAP